MSKLTFTLDAQALLHLEKDGLSLDIDLSRSVLGSLTRPWSQDAPAWQIVSIRDSEVSPNTRSSFAAEASPFSNASHTAEVSLVCGPLKAVFSCHVNEMDDLDYSLAYSANEEILHDFSGGLRIDIAGKADYSQQRDRFNVTLPHVLYNDNPSAAPERTVAHLGHIPNQGHICEEHRLPIPAVNVCWQQDRDLQLHCGPSSFCGQSKTEGPSGNPITGSLSLLSHPEVHTGEDEDYASLGALVREDGITLCTLTGAVMFSGQKDVVYGGQCVPRPFPLGYRDLIPGQVYIRHFTLRLHALAQPGQGFRDLVRMGYQYLKPHTIAQHSGEQIVQYKKNVLDSRFYEDNRCVGYETFGTANKFGDISHRPPYFLYAWTGQSLKLAWCDCVLGLKTNEAWRLKRGTDAADFYVKGSTADVPGLHRQYFYIPDRHWGAVSKDGSPETISARMEGESMSDLLDLCFLFRQAGKSVPSHWEVFLREGCDFLMDPRFRTKDGVYPFCWYADGRPAESMMTAAGMPCVTALCKAAAYFNEPAYLKEAEAIYTVYADLHMRDFSVPFARATMDARCEDKEAALPFMIAASALWQLTGKDCYLDYARIAADWMLTFVYFWETGFLPDTICDRKGFRTTGWPGVSVQNHHLDVFFPTYELAELAQRSGDAFLGEMAQHVQDALTYGISTYPGEWGFSVIGEQGEQYYHTNYGQKLTTPERDEWWRGGMHCWNPSWITAQVMQPALHRCYCLPGVIGRPVNLS